MTFSQECALVRLLEMTIQRLHISIHTQSDLLADDTLGDHVLDSAKRDPAAWKALVKYVSHPSEVYVRRALH